MKKIKWFLWFMKESKKFTNYGYFRIIFKEQGIKRGKYFVNNMMEHEKAIKQNRVWHEYINMDRTI